MRAGGFSPPRGPQGTLGGVAVNALMTDDGGTWGSVETERQVPPS